MAELTRLPPGYFLGGGITRLPGAQLRAVLTLNQETTGSTGLSDRTSPPALRPRGGELRWWIGRPRISARSFPGWRVSASATFATCVPSPRRGPTRKFCSLLQNCPGVMVCRACSTV